MSSSARRSEAPLVWCMQNLVELRSTGQMRTSVPTWPVRCEGETPSRQPAGTPALRISDD